MDRKVYAFVDHTNINIMAQKVAGRIGEFPDGVDDQCVRVVPFKIFDHLQAELSTRRGRLEQLYVYTSDNAVASHENIGSRKIVVRPFKQSSHSKREKLVDTYMVADAVQTIFEKNDPLESLGLGQKNPGLLSLWGGDTDILTPIIDKAIHSKWDVEVWSFKGSLSAVVAKYPQVTIRHLDEVYQEISERKTGWKPNAEKIPTANESFKLWFDLDSTSSGLDLIKEGPVWREIVEKLTERCKLPLQAWFDWNNSSMFLILAVPKKDMNMHMRVIWDQKTGMEKVVSDYINRKHNLRCRVEIKLPGNYPQPQGNYGHTPNGHARGEFRGRGQVRGRGRGNDVRGGPQQSYFRGGPFPREY